MEQPAVLVVDDNRDNLFVAGVVLEHAGYTVLTARRGADGVALAREHQPALVLTDIHMPRMSGFDVLVALRGDPLTAHIPVAAITADWFITDEIARRHGFCALIHMPVPKEGLVATVTRCVKVASGKAWIDLKTLPIPTEVPG
jgi:CheY-like chemotaxis protein